MLVSYLRSMLRKKPYLTLRHILRFSEGNRMKELNTFQLVKVPEGLEASVKARSVTVKGPRGSLTKAFKHLSVDIYKVRNLSNYSRRIWE